MAQRIQFAVRVFIATGSALAVLAMTGCSAFQVQGTGATSGDPAAVGVMQGNVHGGQQPISGAVIQLYTAGMTGYGSAATPLLPTSGAGAVLTESNGFFTLPAYTCPSNSYVYLTATGGNPQVLAGSANPNIALMTALGSCTALQTNLPFIQVNEATTIAAVWALQQFVSITAGTPLSAAPGGGSTPPSFSIGTSATNLQGLINAFNISKVLTDPTTGLSPGANTSGTQNTVENWQVNTLADIIASCINSNPAGGDTGCSSLFAATHVGASTPADTMQAAWLIAQNPANNVQAIFAFSTPTAPFQPTANFENDFTIGFGVKPSATYGTYLGSTSFLSFDSYGNAWVVNDRDSKAGGSVMEFDPQGNVIGNLITSYNLGSAASQNLVTIGTPPTSSGSSRTTPYEVYIDPSNNAWTTDGPNGNVFRIAGSGSAGGANGGGGAAAFGIHTGNSSLPAALAIDGNGIIWVTLQGSTGGYNSTFGSSTTGLAGIIPVGTGAGPLTGGFMAADNKAGTTLSTFLVVDATKPATYAGGPFIDVITQGTCVTSKIGTIAQHFDTPATIAGTGSSTTIAAGGLTPASLMIDAGVSCSNSGTVLPSVTAIYGGTTYTVPALYQPTGAAIDGLDNLWVLNTPIVSAPIGYPISALSKLTPSYSTNPATGALVSSYTTTSVTGGGLPFFTAPQYPVIDGNNNVWVTTQLTGTTMSTFAEFDNAGNALSPNTQTVVTATGTSFATGFFGGNTGTSTKRLTQTRRAIAIDLSGNVWTADAGSAGQTLFVLVGQAVPVVTPLSLALKNGTVGTRP